MNRDMIDRLISGDDIKPETGTHMVDLNGDYSPAVLAGILGVSPANIYQLQQQGRLTASGSLRNAIQQSINYWKDKASNRGGSAHEISLLRKSELDRAKVELTWLQVKKERNELVDKTALEAVLAPVFLQIRAQLIAFSRKHAFLEQDVDKLLQSWSMMGQVHCKEAEESLNDFVTDQLDELTAMEDEVSVPMLPKSEEQ